MKHRANRFRDENAKRLMLATIIADPKAKQAFKQLLKMDAYDIRPDYYLRRKSDNTFESIPDQFTWNANLDAFGKINSMGVCMLRGQDGEWFFVEN